MSHVLGPVWWLVCIHTLKNDQLTLSQPGAQDPGWPQKHHKKSWISKPASKATKAMTVAPKATQSHEKNNPGNMRNPISAKVVFCNTCIAEGSFLQSQTPKLKHQAGQMTTMSDINLRSGCRNDRNPASRSQRASTHSSRGIWYNKNQARKPSNRSEPKVLKQFVHNSRAVARQLQILTKKRKLTSRSQRANKHTNRAY